MSGVLKLTGSLSAGPATAADSFPSMQGTTPLALLNGSAGKSFGSAFPTISQNVNSPGAFQALPGVGPGQPVPLGTACYFKSSQPMQVELTMVDLPADLVSVLWVQGLGGIIEFPQSHELIGLRVKGTGIIEYMVVGNSAS